VSGDNDNTLEKQEKNPLKTSLFHNSTTLWSTYGRSSKSLNSYERSSSTSPLLMRVKRTVYL